jgi:hypothetical protein
MNDESPYLPILKRVGVVLIVVGVIDIGSMIYCIVHRMNYRSSLNIFAVIAGVFLLRGSLRAAKAISLYGAFLLAGLLPFALALPVIFPLGLASAAFRIYPMESLASLAYVTVVLGSLFWVVRQLRSETILAASARSAVKVRSLTVPILAGAAIAAFAIPAMRSALSSDQAKRAEQIAAGEVPSGFDFCVTSMKTVRTSSGKKFSAVVTAWNDHEIRQVPVGWDE